MYTINSSSSSSSSSNNNNYYYYYYSSSSRLVNFPEMYYQEEISRNSPTVLNVTDRL